MFKSFSPFKKEIKTQKPSVKDPRYDTKAYRDYSILLRTVNSRCAIIKKEFTPSQLILDHIIPVSQGGSFWDKRNHQVLHFKAHNIKTQKEKTRLLSEFILNEHGEKIPADWETRVTAFNFKDQL